MVYMAKTFGNCSFQKTNLGIFFNPLASMLELEQELKNMYCIRNGTVRRNDLSLGYPWLSTRCSPSHLEDLFLGVLLRHLGRHEREEGVEGEPPAFRLVHLGDHLADLLLTGLKTEGAHCNLYRSKSTASLHAVAVSVTAVDVAVSAAAVDPAKVSANTYNCSCCCCSFYIYLVLLLADYRIRS